MITAIYYFYILDDVSKERLLITNREDYSLIGDEVQVLGEFHRDGHEIILGDIKTGLHYCLMHTQTIPNEVEIMLDERMHRVYDVSYSKVLNEVILTRENEYMKIKL